MGICVVCVCVCVEGYAADVEHVWSDTNNRIINMQVIVIITMYSHVIQVPILQCFVYEKGKPFDLFIYFIIIIFIITHFFTYIIKLKYDFT